MSQSVTPDRIQDESPPAREPDMTSGTVNKPLGIGVIHG